jgi:hypothetical protein
MAFHESSKDKTINTTKTEVQKYRNEYDSILTKINSLNIGQNLTKSLILDYSKNTPFYCIWTDVKYQTKDSCLYELKGAFNKEKTESISIEWRFYIKTKQDKIFSIIKGR